MIPTAGPAYLDNMHGELRIAGGQQHEFLGCPRRSRDCAQMFAKTHDTSVSCSLRQIGHTTALGFP